MNLEVHPAMHYLVMLLFYVLGLLMNILAGAYLAARSQLTGIKSVTHYFQLRWIPISIRVFACLCMYFVLWENPHLLNLEKYMPNLSAHLGVAGLLGFVSDQAWDKFLALVLPGIQKELPPIPADEPPK